MLIIDEDNVISLTRGDTAYLNLNLIKEDGEPYTYQDGDTVTLSCKQDYDSEDYLFQKVVPASNDGTTIAILPIDTKGLDYGKYVYDIQVNTVDQEVFTVIGPAKFNVTKEVTE